VTMNDGPVVEFRAGDIFYVPPGHDSEVIGDERYVSLRLIGAETYTRWIRIAEADACVRSNPLSSDHRLPMTEYVDADHDVSVLPDSSRSSRTLPGTERRCGDPCRGRQVH
jgi:hypothetical protein